MTDHIDYDYCEYCEIFPNEGTPEPVLDYSLDEKFTLYVCKRCLHKILEEELEKGEYQWEKSTHDNRLSVYDCEYCDSKTNRFSKMCKKCRYEREEKID